MNNKDKTYNVLYLDIEYYVLSNVGSSEKSSNTWQTTFDD